MKGVLVGMLCCILLVVPGFYMTASEPDPPPTDPFDALIVATSNLADAAVALKPTADNVDAKAEAVTRKEAELADAQSAHNDAKETFNVALSDFLDAIDALKAAALEVPPVNGVDPPG